jgi:hypothetical protein
MDLALLVRNGFGSPNGQNVLRGKHGHNLCRRYVLVLGAQQPEG